MTPVSISEVIFILFSTFAVYVTIGMLSDPENKFEESNKQKKQVIDMIGIKGMFTLSILFKLLFTFLAFSFAKSNTTLYIFAFIQILDLFFLNEHLSDNPNMTKLKISFWSTPLTAASLCLISFEIITKQPVF